MTFQAYTRSRRLSRAFNCIREGMKLDDAVLDSGYDSHSGFRDAFGQTFGFTPGDVRNRSCITIAWIQTPLGPMIAGANAEGICLLEFTDRRMLTKQLDTVRKRFGTAAVVGTGNHLALLERELSGYFTGSLCKFTVPLVFPGTPFQRRVWERLLEVPYGETRSYYDLATNIGTPAAVRAVGRANGMNRIAILIPCHRIVEKSGGLGGYGGGLRRKQYLLNLEQTTVAAKSI